MAERDEWQAEVRAFWDRQHADMVQLIAALEGGIVSALDDLKAAVAGQEEVGNRVAALVNTLQDQVTALQAEVQALVDQGNADLAPLVERITAISNELTAAEAPNEPAPEPEPQPEPEPAPEG